jgi:hypothetical protein
MFYILSDSLPPKHKEGASEWRQGTPSKR